MNEIKTKTAPPRVRSTGGTRQSSDSVWPLRGADGLPFHSDKRVGGLKL